jgi:hypothetical protein
MMCGGTGPVNAADAEIQAIVDSVILIKRAFLYFQFYPTI